MAELCAQLAAAQARAVRAQVERSSLPSSPPSPPHKRPRARISSRQRRGDDGLSFNQQEQSERAASEAEPANILAGQTGRQLLSVGGVLLTIGLYVLIQIARRVAKAVRKARRRKQGFELAKALKQR